jgi:hypothetical protein
VLVAAAMFPIIGMTAFAIDVSHWFNYSRNLQNRADAAAFAGGDAYGDICFRSAPGDVWSGAQSTIGEWAQLYGGPGTGLPSDGGTNPNDPPTAGAPNVPYADASVFTATGVGSYQNQPNLTKGPLSRYYIRLNANNYADKGGTDFAMGTFCNSDPHLDATDKNPGSAGAMVDVKVTQYQLGNFVPIFGAIGPSIEAHARVQIQQIQGAKDVRPIAVNDAAFIPCITANFLDADGTVIAQEKLTQSNATPGLWTSLTDAKAIAPVGADPVTVELFLNNCDNTSPTGTTYDYFDSHGHGQKLGLVYINNYGNPGSVAATGAPIVIGPSGSELGGVTLSGASGGSCDPYFTTSTGNCSVGVHADVKFQNNTGVQTFFLRANITGGGGGPITLTQSGGSNGTVWDSGGQTFTIPSDTGEHDITLEWAQEGGVVAGHTCKLQGQPNPYTGNAGCTGTFAGTTGTQRLFSGIDGTNACNNPNFETGPMQYIDVGSTDGGGITSGANAYGQGTAPHLYVTTKIIGLSDSGPTDPPICLRVAESTSHATGFVNCGYPGQPGGSADQNAVVNGCPPVQIDTRTANGALICTPANTPIDCVQNDPGQSPPVLKSFDDLIGTGAGAPSSCETNFWPAATGADPNHTFTIDDKRAVVMIITAPTDMAVAHGTSDIPIREFAVFYVTGWSTGNGGVKGCSGGSGPPGYTGANDPPPTGAGNGEIWGHWTSIAVPSGLGTGNGQGCNFNQFGNCVAVLTR